MDFESIARYIHTGEYHGGRSYSPWGHKDSDRTKRLHFHFHFQSFIVIKHSLLLVILSTFVCFADISIAIPACLWLEFYISPVYEM